jgi:acyl transferase domain-containing protein
MNSRRSVVVSGEAQAEVTVMGQFARQGGRVALLRVSHVFHSPLMDPMLAGLEKALRSLSFNEPTIPLTSTVTGRPADTTDITSSASWMRQVSALVRFADALDALAAAGASTLVEIGPSAALATHIASRLRMIFASEAHGLRYVHLPASIYQ